MQDNLTSQINIRRVEKSKIESLDFDNIQFGKVFTDHMLIMDYKDGEWGIPDIKPFEALVMHPATSVLHYGQSIFEGLKAYKNEVVKNINVYGEMHRYIPILASNEGYTKIEEKIIKHRPRKYGQTKFGMNRFTHGFLDLVTIWFLSRFGKRPMHFFGTIGALMLMIGFAFAAYLGIDKVYFNPSGRLITERPEFFISLTTMILGSQFFVAGFLGEMMTRNNQSKKHYNIDTTIQN